MKIYPNDEIIVHTSKQQEKQKNKKTKKQKNKKQKQLKNINKQFKPIIIYIIIYNINQDVKLYYNS